MLKYSESNRVIPCLLSGVDDITAGEEPIEQDLVGGQKSTKGPGAGLHDHQLDVLPTLDPSSLESELKLEDLVNIDSKDIEDVLNFKGMEGVPDTGTVLPSPSTSKYTKRSLFFVVYVRKICCHDESAGVPKTAVTVGR